MSDNCHILKAYNDRMYFSDKIKGDLSNNLENFSNHVGVSV